MYEGNFGYSDNLPEGVRGISSMMLCQDVVALKQKLGLSTTGCS